MNSAMRRKSNDPQKSLIFAIRIVRKSIEKRERIIFLREIKDKK